MTNHQEHQAHQKIRASHENIPDVLVDPRRPDYCLSDAPGFSKAMRTSAKTDLFLVSFVINEPPRTPRAPKNSCEAKNILDAFVDPLRPDYCLSDASGFSKVMGTSYKTKPFLVSFVILVVNAFAFAFSVPTRH